MGLELYRASAGSGKTYTLVKEYIKLVLEKPEKFNNILAITFTNKAAAEMKERIIKSLKNLSSEEDRDLEELIRRENPQIKNIKKSSEEVLKCLLHNYTDFAVTTIDSFIFKLINSFALELNLPLYFDVDLNYEKMDTYVLEKILAEVGEDVYVTDIILKFIFSKIWSGKSWNVEDDIRRFEKQISVEKNLNWIETIGILKPEIFYDFIQELEKIRNQYRNQLNSLGKRGYEMISSAGLEIKSRSPAAFLKKTSQLKTGEIKEYSLYKSFQENKWYSVSAESGIKSSFETLLKTGLSEIREQILSLHARDHSLVLTAIAILDKIYLLAIVNQIKTFVDVYKNEFNVIPIYEFYIKFNRIVKNFSIPFIYSILGEKYIHYLVDEFQDTSRLQWENLFPLIENSIGYDNYNMVVGDGKQSIYRWRGGDVEIMEKDLKEKIHPEQIRIKPLDENHRSKKNIVDFNNGFFKKIIKTRIEKNPLLAKIYDDITQIPVSQKDGFVSVEFLSPENDTDAQIFLKTFKKIEETLFRGYNYSDICILVREKKEGQAIAQSLLDNQIPVISPDSLLLPKVPIIQFLLNVMKFLVNPSDRIIEYSIINFMAAYSKIESGDSKNLFLYNRSSFPPQISEFFSRKEYLIRMPIYELIEEMIRIFGLPESLNFKNSGFLQAFLDVVLSYSSKYSDEILSFLDWWEFKKEDFSIDVPEIKNAVKIMTIHKAKGLEFPVVIIPYADWKHKHDFELWLKSSKKFSKNPISEIPLLVNHNKILENTYFKDDIYTEDEKKWIDNINLLYVAFTRAIDALFIISDTKNENYDFLNKYAPEFMKKGEHENFTYGNPFVKDTKKKVPETSSIETNELISNRWFKKISIRKKSEQFWKFDSSYRSQKVNWGIILHQILSNITKPEDVDDSAEKFVKTGDISANEKEIIKQKLNEFLKIKETEEWFNEKNKIFTEFPIITKDGVIKPDRVVITDEKVVIIDFKTGEEDNLHLKQIKQYEDAVRDMGYEKIESILVYLKNNTIKRVN